MQKKIKTFITVFLCLFIIFSSQTSLATIKNLENSQTILDAVASGKNVDNSTGIGYKEYARDQEMVLIGNIIRVALSFIGIIFLILIIIGGYQWMTAGGNDETIGKAKKRIINATIGLVVVLMAYAITYFILYIIVGKTIALTDHAGPPAP